MIFILPQPACNPHHSPFQYSCRNFGDFLGFRVKPAVSMNVFTDSFPLNFTPKKLNERQTHAVDIQFLLLLLVLKTVSEAHSNGGRQFSARSTRQESANQETPNVGRPDMAKVNEALNGLGLRGSNLDTITESDVSKAYKKKARIHHPDKAAKDKVKESEGIFKKIVSYRDQLYSFINFRNNCR